MTAMTNATGAPRSTKIAWYVTLAVILLGGGAAILYRMLNGLAVTNLSSFTPWGAWVAFYIYFVGLSAGAFLLSTLIYVFGMDRFEKVGRMALLAALVSMFVALTFIGLDLGRMDRAVTPLYRFNWLSPLAWEVRFYTVYIALLATELWFAMRTDLIKLADKSKVANLLTFGSRKIDEARDHKWLKLLGTIGLPIAIFGVHGGTGTIFAVVKARGVWFGPLFPIVFILSAMVSGTALLTLFYVVRQKGRRLPVEESLVLDLGKVLSAVLMVDLGLLVYEFLVPFVSGAHHELAVIDVMMNSRFSWSFWYVQMGMAFIIPLVILFTSMGKNWKLVTVAAASVVVGIVGVRFNIVVPPQIPVLLPGLANGDYSPNLVEWASSFGVIAMGLLLFSLAAELLPLDYDGGAEHGN